jgi:hypothetical protein
MNELVDSDEEVNAADIDENRPLVESSAGDDEEDDDYDEDEVSLVDSDEERDLVK